MHATEVAASNVDLTNALVISAGCRSGYNIVDGAAVPKVTPTLDWTQAFARKRATLVGGTGYQYGDTDFMEYSERLYKDFAEALRMGDPGPVSVGDALVAAKQRYLKETASLGGIHQEALLEATIYGCRWRLSTSRTVSTVPGVGRRSPEDRSDDHRPREQAGLGFAT